MVKKQRLQDDEYEVERIVNRRLEGGRVLYKVKWNGFKDEESTWEPVEHLVGCQDLVDTYEKEHPAYRVAKKCVLGPGKRGRSKEVLEVEDWNLVEDAEVGPKQAHRKSIKKPKPGVLGTEKPRSIVKKWRESSDWKFEVSWEDKDGLSYLNSEVKLHDLRDKEPQFLIDFLVKELR